MLDKSIPYYNVLMLRKAHTPIPTVVLKEGYTLKTYKIGDEVYWSKILVEVGEFDSFEEAMSNFKDCYASYPEELAKRMLFIHDSDDEICATYTNWWDITNGHREPTVHWLATAPKHQGNGLAKYLVCEGMKRMIELEGEGDYILHTQTWSYQAVGIYQFAGYGISPDVSFADYDNTYSDAIPILREKMNVEPIITYRSK